MRLYNPNLSFAGKITRKMGSVSLTEELHVHESLETGPFMLTLSRCKEKLKTELLVGSYTSEVGQTTFVQVSKTSANTVNFIIMISLF